MTIKDLSEYYNIKTEIKQLEDNINELEETIIGSSKVSGMPIDNKNNIGNPTQRLGMKLARLRDKLINKQEKLIDEFNKIEDFITTVEDSEIRVIIRKRFLEGKTWNVVSKEIIADRSTPYYRLKKYLEVRSKQNDEKEKK